MQRLWTMMIALACWSLSFGLPAAAQRGADIDALFNAMRMEQMFEVMQEEGEAYGDMLANDMLPGGTDPHWQRLVRRLHDPDGMEQIVRGAFEASIGDADLEPLVRFFSSETGIRIIELELAARRAFLDAAVEEAARNRYREVQEPYDAHLAAIEAYVDANDLVELNVVGALNANLLFLQGLVEGGAFEMSESEMLSDVWAQEGATRVDTHEWVYAFLMMAYEPLSVEELNAYVALSDTPEGQALNRALFAGFDQMYGAISLSLGMALARQMQGEAL